MPSESMNYNQTVNKCLSQIRFDQYPDGSRCTKEQQMLRTYIAVSPSYLMLDSSNPETTGAGIEEWAAGMNNVLDVLVELHSSSQLECETVQALCEALSESWGNSFGITKGTEAAQQQIKGLVARLRGLMDDPDSTSSVMHFNGNKIDLDFM
jgi:hypothetical protein